MFFAQQAESLSAEAKCYFETQVENRKRLEGWWATGENLVGESWFIRSRDVSPQYL